MCEKGMHEEIDCPWIYSRCKMVPCNGLRKLLKAQTDDHAGEKFFSCSICSYFEWFSDATTPGKAMQIQLPSPLSCFACGDKSHGKSNCPWANQPYKKKKCKGTVTLYICNNEHNGGIAYLKCTNCLEFQWLSDAVFHQSKAATLKMTELCKQIGNLNM